MQKIRKGDTVVVLTGKDKGKQGEVVKALPTENRVVVKGVNIVKRHTRATQFTQGGIIEKEAAIHVFQRRPPGPEGRQADPRWVQGS